LYVFFVLLPASSGKPRILCHPMQVTAHK
jgi:hypothetical protein